MKDIDIDRVWAQAYHLYKTGFKYEMSSAEIKENEDANSKHQFLTNEVELIQQKYIPSS